MMTRSDDTKTQTLQFKVTVRIPLNPATDSERIRPPLGAPRRRASVVCLEWPTSVCFGQPFAHGFSLERDLIGIVHEPVKNGIG